MLNPSTSQPDHKAGTRPFFVGVSKSGASTGDAAMCRTSNFCFEVMHPDAVPIGCPAGLCSGFPPALSCSQQLTSQAAQR